MDPASTWAGAALVATSPSITPDYPTTEPRLRAQLQALVAARAAGDAAAPALVAEADLFLRLCPAPTIGVTGTKGKTTTASLAHAILAADPLHPSVLGGNIGVPLIERLPELTPGHRVVIELSELQLPTLSRGTTVAVYTNVTSDHLDRHGSVEAYRRVKRRLAELVDPDGALVLNIGDPVVGRVRRARHRAGGPVPRRPAGRRRPGRPRRLDRRRGRGAAAARGRRGRRHRTGRGGHAGGRARDPWPPQRLERPRRDRASASCSASPRTRSAAPPPAFAGVEHRLQPVALVDGVRFVNDSQGTQPDAVIAALRAFEPPVVLIAGGRDKGVDLGELVRVAADTAAAAVLIGESGPDLEARLRAAGVPRTTRAATMDEAVAAADALAREALAGAAGGHGRDGAAEPGRGVVRHVRGLRGAGPRVRRGRRTSGGGPMSTTSVPVTRPGRRGRGRRSPSSGSATSPSTGSSSRSSPSRPSAS